MKSIALIGAKGFVGRSIMKYLLSDENISTTSVTRENYEEARTKRQYDIVINAAMPSKRFWAKQNPYKDFNESVVKTFNIVHTWNSSKIVQISSISARSQLNTIYGKNKAAAEQIIDSERDLIIRLGPMYGTSLDKGVLIDMINNNKVYISKESLYCFAPVDWIGEWISKHLHLSGIIELGANNGIKLQEVANIIGSNSIFNGPIDHQIVSKEIKNAPEARKVLDFILKFNSPQ